MLLRINELYASQILRKILRSLSKDHVNYNLLIDEIFQLKTTYRIYMKQLTY